MADSDRPTVPTPLMAGTRDASWYDRPNVRTVKAWHIATDIDTSACAPGPKFHSGVMVLDKSYTGAEEIFDDLRCRRPGCRKHWDTVPSKPRRTTGSLPCCEFHANRSNGLPCDGACCDDCPGVTAPHSSRCDCDWFEGAWVEVDGEGGIDPETCGCGHEADRHEARTGACTQQVAVTTGSSAVGGTAPYPCQRGCDTSYQSESLRDAHEADPHAQDVTGTGSLAGERGASS